MKKFKIDKKSGNVLKETFGMLKGVKCKSKKPTSELLKEVDRELWGN